jgi:hypothetical protein
MSYLFLVLVLSLPGLDADGPPRQPKSRPAAARVTVGVQGALTNAAPIMIGD